MAQEHDLVTRLINETPALNTKPQCVENVTNYSHGLLSLFGLDLNNPTTQPDLTQGFQITRNFLDRICRTFEDPTHIVRISPFAYAYLGQEMFAQTLGVVLDRAKVHPNEQPILDEIFTATSLIQPSQRANFLGRVRELSAIESDDFFGLGMHAHQIDPTATFTTVDEFPHQFHTSDVKSALELLSAFLELGFYTPGVGFTTQYDKVLSGIQNLDFLTTNPSLENTLLISKQIHADKKYFQTLALPKSVETTPDLFARPDNNGKYPAIVLVNNAISPAEVKKLYKHSTVLYFARTDKERKSIETALGQEYHHLLIPSTEATLPTALDKHLKFVTEHYEKARVVAGEDDKTTGQFNDLFKRMIDIELANVRKYLIEGNEFFFDISTTFEDLGRKEIIERLVKEGGYTVPKKTDNNLILLVSKKDSDLAPYFSTARKKVRSYTQLANADTTGLPFVLVTNQPLNKSEILANYPSISVLYFAANDKEEKAIHTANPEGDIVVVNKTHMEKARVYDLRAANDVGYYINKMFFTELSQAKNKGRYDLFDVAQNLSNRIKSQRDNILFSNGLNSFARSAVDYWEMQQLYKGIPLIMQSTDDLLMKACPTGGCYTLGRPQDGGCCSPSNYVEILVDLAVEYRKLVGEDNFFQELKKFNKGKDVKPWYFKDRHYASLFPDKKGAKKADMEF